MTERTNVKYQLLETGALPREFTNVMHAAMAFHLANPEKRPAVIVSYFRDDMEVGAFIGSTTVVTRNGKSEFGKSAGGNDAAFIQAYLEAKRFPIPELVVYERDWGCVYGWRCDQDGILALGESKILAMENWKQAYDSEMSYRAEIQRSEEMRRSKQCALF